MITPLLYHAALRGIFGKRDAQNDTSRHLAQKFGFRIESEYSVYWLS